MDDQGQIELMPADIVAERIEAYCKLIAQIEGIGPRNKDLRAEAMEFAKAVRATIQPKEKPSLTAIKGGGTAKPL